MTVGIGLDGPAPFSMRVSAKAHYGLRMMTELAKSYGTGPRSLNDIAHTEYLSLPYLEQLARPLRRGGLIESTRGQHGGYTLSRPPGEISVLTIVSLVEGEVAPVECVAHDYVSGACLRDGDCSSRSLWQRLKASIDTVLSSTTLAEMVGDTSLVDTWGHLAPLPMVTGAQPSEGAYVHYAQPG